MFLISRERAGGGWCGTEPCWGLRAAAVGAQTEAALFLEPVTGATPGTSPELAFQMVLEPKGIKGTQGCFNDEPSLSGSCFVWDRHGADQRENCSGHLKFLLQLFSTVLVLNGQINRFLQRSGVRQSHGRHFQLGLLQK